MPAELTEEELARLEALLAKAKLGRLQVNRHDYDDGDINYQLQQVGRPGAVVCNILESSIRNNRAVAEAVCGVLNAAEELLASTRALQRVRRIVSNIHTVEDWAELRLALGLALTATAEPTAGEDDHG